MHWRATTQDITDAATVLQIREALVRVDDKPAAIAKALAKLAKDHRLTPVIAWYTLRDNIAEVGAVLGLTGGTLGKLSMDVKLMMQTEVAEVFEPCHHGRGSSSTMPLKRNPISSACIHGAISVLHQLAAALMDAMVADHERSTGPANYLGQSGLMVDRVLAQVVT